MDFDRQKFPVLLRGTWFGINRAFRRKLERISITPVQYTVLRNLSEGEGRVLSQQNLADALSTNKNNLADLLNRMEERKLVKRYGNPNDHRNKKVTITKRGRNEFVRARKHALNLQEEILALFSKDEQSALLSCFSRCNGKLDELD
jgi:MarR family transcriptional regulator, lower aerobic nicotinate degradation pathway regulator